MKATEFIKKGVERRFDVKIKDVEIIYQGRIYGEQKHLAFDAAIIQIKGEPDKYSIRVWHDKVIASKLVISNIQDAFRDIMML